MDVQSEFARIFLGDQGETFIEDRQADPQSECHQKDYIYGSRVGMLSKQGMDDDTPGETEGEGIGCGPEAFHVRSIWGAQT